MDDSANRLEAGGGSGAYIWLRYGTQLTANGRSYTIEMNIPMPIGATEEMREQLLREADAGMNQLTNHVEHRAAQLLQSGQPRPAHVPMPAARPAPQEGRTASLPSPQLAPQSQPPTRVRENPPEPATRTQPAPQAAPKEAVVVPPTRPNIGASMPSMPMGDSSSNLSLQQFISYIRENMGLTPKQAMDLLKVKTLSSGINLRDALEYLQKTIGQEPQTAIQSEQRETVPASTANARVNTGAPSSDNSSKVPSGQASTPTSPERGRAVNEGEPVYSFDEEVEPGENDEAGDELEDFEFPRELNAQERVRARNKLSSLRESRGSTTASPSRLQVLNNVVDLQISAEQLQDLVAGVWSVNTIKKLKVDQVEALIYWAKEDDFTNEAVAVLTILEEE